MHRDLLYNYEFRCLPDSSKSHLMLIWLLASQIGNKIPNDPDWIRERIGCHEKVDLSDLIDSGFLIADSKAIASRKQSATPETEAKTEAKTEEQKPPPIKPVKKKVTRKRVVKQKRFREFYDAYPKHVAAKSAEKQWEKMKLDDKCDMIVADIKNRLKNHDTWIEGFIPNPKKYLEEERWTDEIRQRNGQRTGQNAISAGTPRDRHEEAIKRKHGKDNGETVGKDDVVVW